MDLFPAGTKVTRERLNMIPRATLNMIRPGPGIRMFPTGDGGVCLSTYSEFNRGQGGLMGSGAAFNPADVTALYLGKVHSLDADGDLINVYLYDYEADTWEVATTPIYKPHILRYSVWNGASITYLDGTTRTYNATNLNKRYQRRATWVDGGTKTEVQEITEPYFLNEWIWIMKTTDNNLIDVNQAGRGWAAI